MEELEYMQSQCEYYKHASAMERKKILKDFRKNVYALALEIKEECDRNTLMGIDDDRLIKSERNNIIDGVIVDLGDGLKYCYDFGKRELVLIGFKNVEVQLSMIVLFSLADRIVNSIFFGTDVLEIYLPCCKEVGSSTFSNMHKLITVTCIKLRKIGNSAFAYCHHLTIFNAQEVEIIGDNAFASCEDLAELELPKLKVVGKKAFGSCTQLKYVSFPKLRVLQIETFKNCSALEFINIKSVVSINAYVFKDCINLKTVIDDDMETVEMFAFDGCRSMERLKARYPNYMHDSAFSGCKLFKWDLIED